MRAEAPKLHHSGGYCPQNGGPLCHSRHLHLRLCVAEGEALNVEPIGETVANFDSADRLGGCNTEEGQLWKGLQLNLDHLASRKLESSRRAVRGHHLPSHRVALVFDFNIEPKAAT